MLTILPRASLAFGLSLALGGAACGDDLEPPTGDEDADDDDDDDGGGSACVSTEVEEFPDGPFSRPDDLTVKGFECPAGGLADVDLSGRWSLGADSRTTAGGLDRVRPFLSLASTCRDSELGRAVFAALAGWGQVLGGVLANERTGSNRGLGKELPQAPGDGRP